jgi:penicillin-binding protein 1C
MAFDARILHPESTMLDRPTRFGGYAPENFDGGYRGEVTASEALRASLNVPAVAVLERIGPGPFLDRLAETGVRTALPDPDREPGLAVILGGVGVTLEDLVLLYGGLANGGTVTPLQFGAGLVPGEDRQLVSPLAAWYVTRILETLPPPPARLAGADRTDAPLVAYKTGTSYGYRDAWAIGYDATYTIGVWVGRPDGSFSSGRLGRDSAASLLFDAFDLTAKTGSGVVRDRPSGPAPAGALLVQSTADLPLPLRRFGTAVVRAPENSAGPTITFPVAGGRIALHDGGRLPLLWFVNGKAIPSQSWKRRAEWQPDGTGQARITVVDGNGQHASVDIWVE